MCMGGAYSYNDANEILYKAFDICKFVKWYKWCNNSVTLNVFCYGVLVIFCGDFIDMFHKITEFVLR